MQLGSGEDAIISFELLADGHRVERLILTLTPPLPLTLALPLTLPLTLLQAVWRRHLACGVVGRMRWEKQGKLKRTFSWSRQKMH